MREDALPYCGPAPTPGTLAASWNPDPMLLSALVALAAIGMIMLPRQQSLLRPRKSLYFSAGWIALVVALVSPLCALSSALFSARVVHHLILIAIAAPLFALCAPRQRAARATRLGSSFVMYLAALWLWHAPTPYAAALSNDLLYWLMELTLLGSAFLLWRELLQPDAAAGRVLLAHLGVIVQMGLLGALITFAARPLYAPHLLTTQAFGLTPLEDQQLAGLIMWVPAAFPYLAAALYSLAKLVDERAVEQRRQA